MITYLRSILYKNMKLLQGILNSLRPAVVAMIGFAGILILISVFWGSAEQIALPTECWQASSLYAWFCCRSVR